MIETRRLKNVVIFIQIIDFTFPMDINVSAKEFKKLSKYKDLHVEVDRTWQLKTSVIPIVVGSLGLVKKETAKHWKRFLVNKT